MKALTETRCSGEISAHTINSLATWMLEHPLDPRLEAMNELISSFGSLRPRDRISVRNPFTNRLAHELSRVNREISDIEVTYRRGLGRRRACLDVRNYPDNWQDRMMECGRERERDQVRDFISDPQPFNRNAVQGDDIPSADDVTFISCVNIECVFCTRVYPNLLHHMLSNHPGCGSSVTRTSCCGSMSDMNYVLCSVCRNSHIKQWANSCQLETLAPDIIPDENCTIEDDGDQDWNLGELDLDDEKIKSYLGFYNSQFAHEVVQFKDFDPLGCSTVPKISSNPETKIPTHQGRHLNQQASSLASPQYRIVAIQHLTKSMHVLLARSILLNVLSHLSKQTNSANLVKSLDMIGLFDIRKIIRLMTLTALNRIEIDEYNRAEVIQSSLSRSFSQLAEQISPPVIARLNSLSVGIAALARNDMESTNMVVDMCVKVLMMSTVCSVIPRCRFAVTQALVGILSMHGGSSLLDIPKEETMAQHAKFHAEDRSLTLINALSAFVLSNKVITFMYCSVECHPFSFVVFTAVGSYSPLSLLQVVCKSLQHSHLLWGQLIRPLTFVCHLFNLYIVLPIFLDPFLTTSNKIPPKSNYIRCGKTLFMYIAHTFISKIVNTV